jgi:hypothetical protein
MPVCDRPSRAGRRPRRDLRATAAVATAALPLLLATGCVVTQTTSEEPYGTLVGPATLERIPGGDGGAAWLEAVLGPPDTRRPAEDRPGASIWSWVGGTRERGSGSVLIVGGRTDLERRTVTEATVAGGRVLETRQWRDRGPAGSLAPIPGGDPADSGAMDAGESGRPGA